MTDFWEIPGKIDQLTTLWNSGLTMSQIGREMGVSKSAVLGKGHRLGLPSRPSPIIRDHAPTPPKPRVERPKRIVDPVEPRPPRPTPQPRIATPNWPIGKRPCQWPEGDPKEEGFHLCGDNAFEGKPYCPRHHVKAYTRRAA